MDIQVLETGGGGDLSLIGNDIVATTGVTNMPYLGMFGGDASYWGNQILFNDNEDFKFTSETEALLIELALTSGNRLLIEQAIKRDLQFLVDNVPDTVLNIHTQIISDNTLLINVDFGGQQFDMLWHPGAGSAKIVPNLPLPARVWTSPIRTGERSSYAITGFTMSFGSSTATFSHDIFYSEANELSTLAGYNALLSSYGMTGAFAIVGNDIIYNQGASENWSVNDGLRVLPEMAVVELSVPTPDPSPQNWSYTFTGNGSNTVTDFGDAQSPEWYHPTTAFTQTASRVYVDGLTPKTVNIFHDNTLVIVLNFLNSSTAYLVESLSGAFPTSLTQIATSNQNLTNPVDMSVINTLVNLETISLPSGSISSFSPSLITTALPALRAIFVQNNILSSTEVDKIFNGYISHNPDYASITGQIRTNGQTPSAPPTSTSAASRAALIAAGWTIVTD